MHSSSYLALLAVAATTALSRPAAVISETSSIIDNYAASASATIGDYIVTGISGLGDDAAAAIENVPSNSTTTNSVQDDVTSFVQDAAASNPSIVSEVQGSVSNYGNNRNGSAGAFNAGEWAQGDRNGQGGWGNGNQGNDNNQQDQCMSREDALKTAATFQSLIQGYTVEQALAALTPNFVDYTSAVSIIINRGGSGPEDVTAPIFTSREEFMRGHGQQEPIPFETLRVWSTCDGIVSMVWRSIRSGQGQRNESAAIPVTGIAVLETEPTSQSTGEELERAVAGGYNYRIHTLWSEFNTAAWLVNNGVLELEPEVPVTPIPEGETTPSPPSNISKRGQPTSKFDVGLA